MNIPLYVPSNAVEAYKGMDCWSKCDVQPITAAQLDNVYIF